MSKFEEFLDEINTLPIEIRRSLVLMRELDSKKDGTNNEIIFINSFFRTLEYKQQDSQAILCSSVKEVIKKQDNST